jgi:hypothetical protein
MVRPYSVELTYSFGIDASDPDVRDGSRVAFAITLVPRPVYPRELPAHLHCTKSAIQEATTAIPA